MKLIGQVQNVVVVFDAAVNLPEGLPITPTNKLLIHVSPIRNHVEFPNVKLRWRLEAEQASAIGKGFVCSAVV